MILADENIHSHIIQVLREAEFEVISVRESFPSIKDEQVIQLALKHDYLLLTEDKDFGEWVFAHHIEGLNVLFLRYAHHEFQEIAHTLVYLLKTQSPQRPFFATVTTKKIRIRQL
jgi:predicted nuclease of predicted toxin-antitoxin system